MAERHAELIVLRQLASYLAMPIFVQDREGRLVFFNEPAEPVLGRRFDETGALTREELWKLFRPTRQDGSPLPLEESPFMAVRRDHEPLHRRFWLQGEEGRLREVEGTVIPLSDRAGEVVGSFTIFWEPTPTARPARADRPG